MSVMLYGITNATAVSGSGFSGEPLRAVTVGTLTAIVGDLDRRPATDVRSLRAYEDVVERMMSATTVLPARYGTTAEADGEIAAELGSRSAALLAALARVRGAVEYAVHAPERALPQDGESRVGTAYMARLLTRDQAIRELDSAAAGLFRSRRRTGRGTAYLVDRARADAFLKRAAELGLIVTGPWPPYSFTAPV